MKAVENNIQDQLNRVAAQIEGKTEDPKDESLNEDIEEDPNPVDEPKDDDSDSNPDADTEEDPKDVEEERKQAGAFAAMRKRLKELEDENKTLKTKATPEDKSKEEEPEPKKEDPKSGTPDLSDLEQRLNKAETYIKELETKEQSSRVTNEVIQLKEKYGLNDDQLAEFADELEQRNYRIGASSMSLSDMYAAVHHDQLVAKEVEKAKAEIAAQSGDPAPSTGPKTKQGSTGKQKDDIRSTLARVAKQLS